jgi:hypothetical protein
MHTLTVRETVSPEIVSPEIPGQLARANRTEALLAAERPELVSLRFDPIAAFLTFRPQDSLRPDEFSLNGVTLPRDGCYPYCWYWHGGLIEAIVPRDMVPFSYFDCSFEVDAVAKWRPQAPAHRENLRLYLQ